MAKVSINFEHGEITRMFKSIKRASRNMRPLYRNWGEHMINSIVQNFRSSGRPKWKPLSRATLISRVGGSKKAFTKRGKLRKPAGRKMTGLKPLIKSGVLMRSINYRTRSDGVQIGSSTGQKGKKGYGAIHQYGGMAGRGRRVSIPARPYLIVQSEDEKFLSRSLEEHILKDAR